MKLKDTGIEFEGKLSNPQTYEIISPQVHFIKNGDALTDVEVISGNFRIKAKLYDVTIEHLDLEKGEK